MVVSLGTSPLLHRAAPHSTRLSHQRRVVVTYAQAAPAQAAGKVATAAGSPDDPLLLRAVRGEAVARPPVWLMRQAGRYMKVYQELCKKHPSFRERSENVDLAVEISLQPWRAFQPDGVILFSDILTPLAGMNVPFDITKSGGPVIERPIRTMEDVKAVRPLVPEEAVPYVGASFRALKKEVGNKAALLGFVGAPFTLASYVIEGGSSKTFSVIKAMAFSQPAILHALLEKFADSIIVYCRYQADAGAQVIQIFDSWACNLTPADFEVFSLPYLQKIVAGVKATHPHLPLILYAAGSGGHLERMARSGADIISVDSSIDMADARARLGPDVAVQGNVDPAALFGPPAFVAGKIAEVVAKAGSRKHILNLGHGVLVGTPEEAVAHFFETAKNVRY